jgi:hypothetical protein
VFFLLGRPKSTQGCVVWSRAGAPSERSWPGGRSSAVDDPADAPRRLDHLGPNGPHRGVRTVTLAPGRPPAPHRATHRRWPGLGRHLRRHARHRSRAPAQLPRRAAPGCRPGRLPQPASRLADRAKRSHSRDRATLDRTPKDASVLFAQLRLPANDSQIVATQLWELDELGNRYRALTRAAHNATQAARRSPPAGPVAPARAGRRDFAHLRGHLRRSRPSPSTTPP